MEPRDAPTKKPTAADLELMIETIWGLGPKNSRYLAEKGIDRLERLAETPVATLRAHVAAPRQHAPALATWPFQAYLAVKGEGLLLEQLQAALPGTDEAVRHLALLRGLPLRLAKALVDAGHATYAHVAALPPADVVALAREVGLVPPAQSRVELIQQQALLAAEANWERLLGIWHTLPYEPPGGGRPPGDGGGGGGTPPGDGGDGTPPDDSITNPDRGDTMPAEPIVFVDLHERNREVYERLRGRWQVLYNKALERHEGTTFKLNALDPLLRDEFIQLSRLLADDFDADALAVTKQLIANGGPRSPEQWRDQNKPLPLVDPLFYAVQYDLRDWKDDGSGARRDTVADHRDGLFPSQYASTPADDLTGPEKEFAAVYGVMLRENTGGLLREDGPSLVKTIQEGEVFATDLRRLNDQLARARSEYHTHRALYDRVMTVLVREGIAAVAADGQLIRAAGKQREVNAEQVAAVGQTLAEQGLTADSRHLDLLVRKVLTQQARAEDEAPTSVFDIDLPDLEDQADVEIVADNLRAMQAVYFAAILDEMKLFQVMDKIIEMYEYGYMPFGRGADGDRIYQFRRRKVNRLSEYERLNLYTRTLGMAGGDAHLTPNREFQTLWLRFISAVASFARQITVDSLLRATVPGRVHQEQVRKAGRDLASNLSLYGYGMTYHAAVELQHTIQEIFQILKGPEVKAAFGARDVYQVIEQVSALELGARVNTVRARTMATAGATIIAWLVKKARELASISLAPILDTGEILNPSIHPAGSKPTVDPFDSDLVSACERWLAVTGTPDQQVESYADPFEGPVTPSRPIQMPSAARDMLQSVGIGGDGFALPEVGV